MVNKKVIYTVSIIGVLLIAAVVGWAANFQANKYAASLISQQLNNSPVDIENLEITFNRGVLLQNVTVEKAGEKILKAKEIRLCVNPWLAIKKPSSYLQALTSVKVDEPEIWLERGKNGEWNVEKLFPKTETKTELPNDLRPKITWQKGIVHLTDRRKEIKDLNVIDVFGEVDMQDNPQMNFSVLGMESKMPFLVSGYVNVDTKKLHGKVYAKNFNLALWNKYLPLKDELKIEQGVVSVNGIVDGYYPSSFTYSGKISLKDGEVYLKEAKTYLTNIQSEALIDENKVGLKSLTLNLGKTQVKANGDIFLKDKIGADIRLEMIKIAWQDIFKISYLKPYYQECQPYLVGEAKVKAHITYADDKIVLPSYDIFIYQGKISGRGEYDLKKKDFQAEAQAQGLNLAGLNLPVTQGIVDLQAILTGQNNKLTYADARLSSHDLLWENVPIKRAGGNVVWDNGNVWVHDLIVDSPYLKARLNGRKDDIWQANVSKIDLGFWCKKYKSAIPISGIASFKGVVKQNGQKIDVIGDLFADNGRIMAQPFRYISGQAVLQDKKLSLQNVHLQSGLSRYDMQGTIDLKDKVNGDINVRLTTVDLEPWLKYFTEKDLKIKGQVSGLVNLKGTLSNPSIHSDLKLANASYDDERIDGNVLFSYKNKFLNLESLEVTDGQAKLSIAGVMKVGQEGEFTVLGTDINLLRIPYLREHLPWSNRTAQLFGTVKVNNNGRGFILQDFTLEHGENKYSLNGGVMLSKPQPTVNLHLKIENSSVDLLSSLVPNKLPNNFSGRFAGEMDVWGRIDDLKAKGELAIKDGKIGDYSLGRTDTAFTWDRGTLKLEKLVVPVDGGVFVAKGKVRPEGDIDMKVKVKNFNIDTIRVLCSIPNEVVGRFNFEGTLKGKTRNPSAIGQLSIIDAQIGDIGFDELVAYMELKNKELTLKSLVLTKDKYHLGGSGVIDLNKKGKMNFDIRMDDGDLGLLAIFSNKYLSEAYGPAKAHVNIAGTWENPLVKGEMVIENGYIKPKYFEAPIENINTHLMIEQNNLILTYFTAMMDGGTMTVSGKASDLFSEKANLDFHIMSHDFYLKTTLLKGKIDTDITLTGNPEHPLLKGILEIEKGRVNVPSVWLDDTAANEIPIDLDLNIKTKGGLTIKHFLFLMKTEGDLMITGTGGDPKIDGNVKIPKGSINYLGTKFTVLAGSALFKQENGIMPDVKLGSRARVGATKIYMMIKGNATDLTIDFISDPEMPREQIITLLTIGQAMKDGESTMDTNRNLIQLLGGTLSAGLLQGFESSVADSLGLDEFTIGTSRNGAPKVTIGKSIMRDKLYLDATYTTGSLDNHKADNDWEEERRWKMEAQYRLGKGTRLLYNIDSEHEQKVMLTKTFRF